MKKALISCLAVLSLLQLPAFSERAGGGVETPPLLLDKSLEAVTAGLEAGIPGLMAKGRIPGLQAALVREGKVVWQRSFGIKNAASGGQVTDETIFEAASLTKPFFAYAVMKLVDEGLIDLDKPLHTHFTPQEIEAGLGHSLEAEGFKREWFEKITARHVLSHSGGLPHGERERVFPIFFEPGTQWKYSADGYELLSLAVCKLKGETLDKIMQKYVLDPLGMTRSSMVWRPEYEESMASGHDIFGNPQAFRKRGEANAAASLYTTAGEYARFVCAVVNGEGLKPETARVMLASFIDMKEDKSLGWSLGFGLQNDANGTAFWQWGDYGIFRNYIIAYPGRKTAVVYLANSFNGLSVCADLVGLSVGGQALGNSHLNYRAYDSPFYALFFGIKDGGPDRAAGLVAELRAKDPAGLSWETVGWVAGIFRDQNMLPEARAIFEAVFKENPGSGRAAFELARTCLLAGDLEKARAHYRAAGEAVEDKADPKRIEWDLDYLRAAEKPVPLEPADMRRIAGDYGVRHITVKDGGLHYFREGGAAPEPRPLLAFSKDTFFIKGVVYFRFRVEFDGEGRPVKLVGLYDDGRTDETKRT